MSIHILPEYRLNQAIKGAKAIREARAKDRDRNRDDNGENRNVDETIGKLGEEGFYDFKNHSGNPDYSVHQPSYDIDIPEFYTVVKSCRFGYEFQEFDKNRKNGASFLFARKEIKHTFDIEDSFGNLVPEYIYPDDCRVAFMLVDEELVDEKFTGRYKTCGWCFMKEIRLFWDANNYPPYSPNLDWKRAVYLEDFQHLLNPLEDLMAL